MTDRLESNTRTVMVLTTISRVAGLVRDGVLSRFFGANELTSAFWFAFLIPNLFRRLFGEGALTASFLPVYTKLREHDPARAAQLATTLVAVLMMFLGCMLLLGESILFLVSAARDHDDTAIWLMMVTLPYMPLVCLVAFLGAMLQVMGRFGPPAAAPILLNGCIIAVTVVLSLTLGDSEEARLISIGSVAGSMVLAGLLQAGWMLWSLRSDAQWNWNPAASLEPMKQVLRAALPMILGLGALQLNTFLDGIIASYTAIMGTDQIFGTTYPLDESAMTIISYAQRLYQFPLGVFAISVATAIYPLLARKSEDADGFADTVRRGLRLVLFIGVPASVGLALVRQPLTACILEGGAFTAMDVERVAAVLLGYTTAIWAYSMNQVFTKSCYAKMDMMTPVRIAIGVVALNFVLNVGLIWTPLGETSLAWSTAICAVLQCILLMRAAGRHVDRPIDAGVIRCGLRALMLSAVMGGGVWWAYTLMGPTDDFAGQVIRLLLLVVIGTVLYGGGARLLAMPELRWALGRR